MYVNDSCVACLCRAKTLNNDQTEEFQLNIKIV